MPQKSFKIYGEDLLNWVWFSLVHTPTKPNSAKETSFYKTIYLAEISVFLSHS